MAVEAFRLGPTGAGEWTEFHAEELTTSCPPPDGTEIREAVKAALESPLGFPPLSQALTPDDRVAIALGSGTPAVREIISAVVEALCSYGVRQERIAVVTVDAHDTEALQMLGVTVETHDPADEESLCFAGLTQNDRQLKLNRRLFDADVLLPITTILPRDGLSEGPFAGVFPDFADQEAIARFRRVRSVVAAADREGDHAAVRRREVEEAGWMFGAPLLVSIAPGVGGGVAAVVAGDPSAVGERLGEVFATTWGADTPEMNNLVIASLGGSPREQTWGAVGRALEATGRLAAPGGVVVLWTDLDTPIGEAMSHLLDAEDLERLSPQLGEESGEEALAAWRLLQALERGPVFLKSRLPAETVERLGMAPVADACELDRLAERHGSCTLLEEAQHVWLDPQRKVDA